MVFEHNLTPEQEAIELAEERARLLEMLAQEREEELADERPTESNMNLGWGTEAGEMYQAHNEW